MACELSPEHGAEELFKRIIELPLEQRDKFLAANCTDEQLLEMVRSLVAHHNAAGAGFLAGGESGGTESGSSRLSRRHVGPYRLLRVIGQGGMGVVYEAEEPRLQRRVALKLIRPGLMTPPMLRRFEYEASLLARLDHAGIARIYHADLFDDGHGPQPYFAMELIDGRRLDEYMKAHRPRLKTRQLVELFHQICQAVQHAHAKGVVHRDLKPANILITPEGKPKILDFGVARAIDSDVQATTLHTEPGELVGTLPYMSPEQAAGRANDLDTASDVYALGVIAYELFSGELPYALEHKPLHEAVRVICEDEPSRLSSIDKSLRGDVETIVQKALEKDKTRRYATAGELASDVKRYLDYEPVTARAPTTWYQLVRFARRNRGFMMGVAAVLIALLSGLGISVYFAIVATEQRAEAERRKYEAEQHAATATTVLEFLSRLTPDNIPDATVRQQVVSAITAWAGNPGRTASSDRPLTQASVHEATLTVLRQLGRNDLALPHAEALLALRRTALGEEDPQTVSALCQYAIVVGSLRGDAAEPISREALTVSRRVLGDDHAITIGSMINLAEVLSSKRRLIEAEPLLKEAMERRLRILGRNHPESIKSMLDYARLLRSLGRGSAARDAEAEPLYKEALRRCETAHGYEHPDTVAARAEYAGVLWRLKRHSEAESLLREVLQQKRRLFGDDHLETIQSLTNYARFLDGVRRTDEAEAPFKEAMERHRRLTGPDHIGAIQAMREYAYLLKSAGRLTEAEPLFKEALELCRRVLGAAHATTLATMEAYAQVLGPLGRTEEAEPLFRDVLAEYRRTMGEDHRITNGVRNAYLAMLRSRGRLAETEPLLKEFLAARRRILGNGHPLTLAALEEYAQLLVALSRLPEAEPLLAELYVGAATSELPARQAALYVSHYGPLLVERGLYFEAAEPLRVAYERLKTTGQEKHPQFKVVLECMAEVAEVMRRSDEAAKWRAELAALEAATRPATQPATRPTTQPSP